MDKNLEKGFDLEYIKVIGLNCILRIYGNGRPTKFYKLQLELFLNLFLPRNSVDSILSQIDKVYFKEYSRINLSTSDSQNLEKLHNILRHTYFDKISIVQLLGKIIAYDLRLSISLIFAFGLIPTIKNKKDFLENLELLPDLYLEYVDLAIHKLISDILYEKITGVRSFTIKKIQNFFNRIHKIDSLDLLRYEDNELIPYGTEEYKLALVIKRGRIDVSLLDEFQKNILLNFLSSYISTGKFTNINIIANMLDISLNELRAHLNIVATKLPRKNLIKSNLRNYIKEVESGSAMDEIINLYQEDSTILTSPFLKQIHRDYLTFLFQKDAEGRYPSQQVIATHFKVDRNRVCNVLQDAYRRILDGENVFYNSNGNRVDQNEARIKLLPIYEDIEKFELLSHYLDEYQLSILPLLLKRENNRFLYDYNDIALKLKIESYDTEAKLQRDILKICKIAISLNLIPSRNQPRKNTHKILIFILERNGVEKYKNKINKTEYIIAQEMLKKNELGKYLKYSEISERLNISHSLVQRSANEIHNKIITEEDMNAYEKTQNELEQ